MYGYEVFLFGGEHLSTDTTQSRHNLSCLKVIYLPSIVENTRILQMAPVQIHLELKTGRVWKTMDLLCFQFGSWSMSFEPFAVQVI